MPHRERERETRDAKNSEQIVVVCLFEIDLLLTAM